MMIRRWAVLEVREGQEDRVISRHLLRRFAEGNAVVYTEAWGNLRGDIISGRAVWDWTRNEHLRLIRPVPRLHPEYGSQTRAGGLWPRTDYYTVNLTLMPSAEPA
jgi:hypothetical protein